MADMRVAAAREKVGQLIAECAEKVKRLQAELDPLHAEILQIFWTPEGSATKHLIDNYNANGLRLKGPEYW